ncbi:MAG: hypothetical protein QXZ44_00245 [Ferroplasma sp.]
MNDSDIIKNIVARYYKSSRIDETEYSTVFHIDDSRDEKTFSMLLDALQRVGATAFTNNMPDMQIIVIWKHGLGRERIGLKFLMFFATLVAIIYIGYSYYTAYYGYSSLIKNMEYSILLYALPLLSIIFFREAGKYIALKDSRVKYYFPIFIPSPGIGTLGTINSNNNQFKNSSSIIKAGLFSIIFGFVLSISFILAGAFLIPSHLQYSALLSSPAASLRFPLLFKVFLGHFIPITIAPNPLELAGYAGLITTALNGMPLSFLDGGLVFSPLLGRHFKYASYISIAILLFASIIEPYLLILVVLAIILGLHGSMPLNNLVKPKKILKYATIAVLIIVIMGFAPLPMHNGNSSIIIPATSYIVDNKTSGNVSVNITVNNPSHAVPRFSISPGKFYIHSVTVVNSTSSIYDLVIEAIETNQTVLAHYKISVEVNGHSFTKNVFVYFIKPVSNIKVNNSTKDWILNEIQNESFSISLNNTVGISLNSSSIAFLNPDSGIYLMHTPGLPVNSTYPGNLTYHKPGMHNTNHDENITMQFFPTRAGTFTMMILFGNGNAILITINVSPAPGHNPLWFKS